MVLFLSLGGLFVPGAEECVVLGNVGMVFAAGTFSPLVHNRMHPRGQRTTSGSLMSWTTGYALFSGGDGQLRLSFALEHKLIFDDHCGKDQCPWLAWAKRGRLAKKKAPTTAVHGATRTIPKLPTMVRRISAAT